ncbi:MAG: DUF465 domain-containing protein [Micavibrio sp.]|nr:MAG: DUF465 domain-containing protein [Micavibrio sp.]
MSTENHLHALEQQRAELKRKLHKEMSHPAADETLVRQMKFQKLALKDRIEEIRRSATG